MRTGVFSNEQPAMSDKLKQKGEEVRKKAESKASLVLNS